MDTPNGGGLTPEERSLVPAGAGGGYVPPPPPPPDEEDDEDEGMLRMSFLEHLEEMRSRIIRALMGFGVAFLLCIVFCYQLWDFVRAPAVDALTKIGVKPPNLVINEPMEAFSIIWVKVPLVFALFLASPWVLYQVWAFIAPGLYQKEKRLAFPFVLSTAGLFILGGAFAYFVAFRFGLAFLLSIGLSNGVTPLVTITHYFDLFVNVMLGVALVFELPVAIFFLTLLHLASPRFLMQNSRYAILAIVIVAAIITPTPDFFNLMLFAVPMCALFFIGVFASYLLVLKREGRKFPWPKVVGITLLLILLLAGVAHVVLVRLLHYHLASHWPFYLK
ncbi:MAG TPA: twin-arginine translocase subunit TatC [Bryobacteraceae bacterium]|nr:twin-arginine translocase subunit TatC [Bryobacteraceae bacterium]